MKNDKSIYSIKEDIFGDNFRHKNTEVPYCHLLIKPGSKLFLNDGKIPRTDFDNLGLPFTRVLTMEEADFIVIGDSAHFSFISNNEEQILKSYKDKITRTNEVILSYINNIDFSEVEMFTVEELQTFDSLNKELKDSLLLSQWLRLLKTCNSHPVLKEIIIKWFPKACSNKIIEFRRQCLIGKRQKYYFKDVYKKVKNLE